MIGVAGHALRAHGCETVGHQCDECCHGAASFHVLVLEPGFVLVAAAVAVAME